MASTRLGRWAAALFLSSCASRGSIVRKYAERSYAGREVRAEAYSQHLSALLLAADGQKRAAESSLRRALEHDPTSAHLAAVAEELRCRQGSSGATDSLRRLAHSRPESVRLWLALSRCLREQGLVKQALGAAQQGVAAAPESIEASRLVVEHYMALGDRVAAQRWALGLLLMAPHDRRAQALWKGLPSPTLNPTSSGDQTCIGMWRRGKRARSASACARALAVQPKARNARALRWLSGGELAREATRVSTPEPLLEEVQEAIRRHVQEVVGPGAARAASAVLKGSALRESAVQPE